MKSKYWKHLLTIILIIVLAATLPIGALAEDDEPVSGGTITSAGISAGKYIYLNDDGTYTVEIDAFVTGTVTTEYVPCDVILVLDTSESMNSGSMGTIQAYSVVTSARTGVAWTNEGGGLYTNTSYYYKDGNTYRRITIQRQGTSGTRQFTVTVDGYSGAGTAGLTTNNLTIGNNQTQTNVISLVQQALRNSGVTGATVQLSDIYTYGPKNYSRLDALKDSVNLFLDNVAEVNDAADDREGFDPADYNRVSIVTYNRNTQVITGTKDATKGSLVAATKGSVADGLKSDVNGLGYAIYTYTADAMGTAETILEDLLPDDNSPLDRNMIVVLFTDGYPRGDDPDLGSGSSSMNSSMLAPVVNSALTCKQAGAKVFTVAILPNEAMPGVNPVGATNASYDTGATTQTRLVNQMLQAASSNYPAATATTANYMTVAWGEGDYTQGYFMAAESADDLKEIFKKISEEAAASTDLGSEAVMKDVVASSFTLPPAVLESEHPEDFITVSIVRWNTQTRTWGTGSDYVFTPEQWKTECLNYGVEENVSVAISGDGTTLDVTGFDYATHFKATDADQDADPDFDQSNANKNTAKIVFRSRSWQNLLRSRAGRKTRTARCPACMSTATAPSRSSNSPCLRSFSRLSPM